MFDKKDCGKPFQPRMEEIKDDKLLCVITLSLIVVVVLCLLIVLL